MIEEDEDVIEIVDEISFSDTLSELSSYLSAPCSKSKVVPVNSIEMYVVITEFVEKHIQKMDAYVHTKYKTVDKKIKHVAVPVLKGSEHKKKEVVHEPILRDLYMIGHKFSEMTLSQLQIGEGDFLSKEEQVQFKNMLKQYGKAFAFAPNEIGCVDPNIVEPMIIFTVPHIPWNFRPIPVPRSRVQQLIELLNEKIEMGILEPSSAPYSNRWFTVPKKNGSLRFIQDLQPVNKVTIRNVGIGPTIDEFTESFAGRAIYSMADLYSGYDQFQLAIDSRDITTMRTPVGLLRMCTLPQGATNSVAHMMNGMYRVLKDFIPHITMPFLDDIPLKGCLEEEKDVSLDENGCRKFVSEHIKDCEKVLKRIVEVHLTLSGQKSTFGQQEILVVGHMCGPYGRKPSPTKIDAIQRLRNVCESPSEVRRFLGACLFYHMWIPHYAHIADPLYQLLRKNQNFEWDVRHSQAMQHLKELLSNAPVLRKPDYTYNKSIIVTVDTSPVGIGWALSQNDVEGNRYAIRFGAKVLNSRQRAYSQVKRELWGIVTALKTDRDYLIGVPVIVETDCLPLLGMITNCSTPDITMLRWISYIKSLSPDFIHIAGKNNLVADMLSRARYENEEEMQYDSESSNLDYFVTSNNNKREDCSILALFQEREYSDEMLLLGRYLSSLQRDNALSDEQFKKLKRKAKSFFLHDGHLWKHPKRKGMCPQRVISMAEAQQKIIKECHEELWAGHRGVWATFAKVKERFWWYGMYKNVKEFVETCEICQMYSMVRHRDGLHPTFPLAMHYKWAIDLVMMPKGIWQMQYLVLAREDLTNQVEGRALRTKTTNVICKFILEEIICRYGCVGKIIADRGELNAHEAHTFFTKLGIKLSLTTTYNPEANGKIERGHSSIVRALVRACDGKPSEWPRLLPFALWADRTTHSSVTGFMPAELIYGQKPIMPIEESIISWSVLPWYDGMSREELLALRIRQLERKKEDVTIAIERIREARLRNKHRFDKTHRLRPQAIHVGDWVLVYDNSLDNQHSTIKKFAKRWFGPYVVKMVYDNATYALSELDGTDLRIPIAGKRIKIFKKRKGTCIDQLCISDDDTSFLSSS